MSKIKIRITQISSKTNFFYIFCVSRVNKANNRHRVHIVKDDIHNKLHIIFGSYGLIGGLSWKRIVAITLGFALVGGGIALSVFTAGIGSPVGIAMTSIGIGAMIGAGVGCGFYGASVDDKNFKWIDCFKKFAAGAFLGAATTGVHLGIAAIGLGGILNGMITGAAVLGTSSGLRAFIDGLECGPKEMWDLIKESFSNKEKAKILNSKLKKASKNFLKMFIAMGLAGAVAGLFATYATYQIDNICQLHCLKKGIEGIIDAFIGFFFGGFGGFTGGAVASILVTAAAVISNTIQRHGKLSKSEEKTLKKILGDNFKKYAFYGAVGGSIMGTAMAVTIDAETNVAEKHHMHSDSHCDDNLDGNLKTCADSPKIIHDPKGNGNINIDGQLFEGEHGTELTKIEKPVEHVAQGLKSFIKNVIHDLMEHGPEHLENNHFADHLVNNTHDELSNSPMLNHDIPNNGDHLVNNNSNHTEQINLETTNNADISNLRNTSNQDSILNTGENIDTDSLKNLGDHLVNNINKKKPDNENVKKNKYTLKDNQKHKFENNKRDLSKNVKYYTSKKMIDELEKQNISKGDIVEITYDEGYFQMKFKSLKANKILFFGNGERKINEIIKIEKLYYQNNLQDQISTQKIKSGDMVRVIYKDIKTKKYEGWVETIFKKIENDNIKFMTFKFPIKKIASIEKQNYLKNK